MYTYKFISFIFFKDFFCVTSCWTKAVYYTINAASDGIAMAMETM